MTTRHPPGRSGCPALLLAGLAVWLFPVHPAAAGTPWPVLTIEDARIVEGDSGTRILSFPFKLSFPAPEEIQLGFFTESVTAVADSDFVPNAEHLELPAQATGGTIDVLVLGDSLLEANEVFRVHLADVAGVEVPDSVAVGTILNDERTVFVRDPWANLPPYPCTLPLAFGDPDGDGDVDLPLYEQFTVRGFRERDGFRDQLDGDNFHGGAWCDFDRDGDDDLVILPYALSPLDSSRCRLFRNDAGELVDVAAELGLNLYGNGETPVWGDFNGDMFPDLFAPYYSYVPPYRSFLYFNNGDGTFREDGIAAGVALIDQPEALKPEGAQAVDWNGDGFLDLYCASHLFQNDGTGSFTDVRAAVGLPAVFDEGAEFVDYDSDGDFDLYLRCSPGPLLYRNDGASFTDVTAAAGIPTTPMGWGDRWADVENDGDMDLLLCQFDAPMQLLLNAGDGTFAPDSAFAALDVRAYLTAFADVDRDGDVDFASTEPPAVYLNRLEAVPGGTSSSLRVLVLGEQGHRVAFGSTVRLRHTGAPEMGVQARAVDGGSAYLGQNEYAITFGGVGAGPWTVDVEYPGPPGVPHVLDPTNTPALGALHDSVSTSRTVTIFRDGRIRMADPADGVVAVTPWSGPAAARQTARIAAVAPLPARAQAGFVLDLARAGRVGLTVHDVHGRIVRTIPLGRLDAGPARAAWDLRDERGRRAAPGVYFVRLAWEGQAADVSRLVVLP